MWLNDVLLGILVVIWQKESLFTLCIKFFSTDELYDLPKSGNKPGRIVGKSANFRFFRPIRRQLQSAGWYRLVGVTNYGLIIEISQNSSHLHSSCAAGSTACLRANISLQFAVLILFPWQRKKVGEEPFIDLQCARVWICRVSIFCKSDESPYLWKCLEIFTKCSFSIVKAAANRICESVSGDRPRW